MAKLPNFMEGMTEEKYERPVRVNGLPAKVLQNTNYPD
jgi:hypothetical protein